MRCPRRPLLDEPEFYTDLFWLYQNYKLGILPEGPSLRDQSPLLLQALQIISEAVSAAEEEKDALRRRKLKSGGPK